LPDLLMSSAHHNCKRETNIGMGAAKGGNHSADHPPRTYRTGRYLLEDTKLVTVKRRLAAGMGLH